MADFTEIMGYIIPDPEGKQTGFRITGSELIRDAKEEFIKALHLMNSLVNFDPDDDPSKVKLAYAYADTAVGRLELLVDYYASLEGDPNEEER